MAIEFLDDGSCKARGSLIFAADPADAVLRAIGITAAVRTGVGVVRVTLLEPIGADEFFAETTINGPSVVGSADLACVVERIDDNVVELRTFDDAGAAAEGQCWFAIYRLAGGLVAETAP